MSDHDQVKMTNMNYDVNRPKAENPVKVMDLSLRDGHQSLFATRGRTEDMIPVAELMDQVGFWAVETWGGATFDTMHRFLNEDPWERIRTLKRYFKKTPFSMLLRAQNLVGYRNYADDVANAFMDRACENGMDIFRTFDALNDYRNFQTVVPKIKEYGKHFQGCICYTMTEPRLGGEVYNLDYYVNKAKTWKPWAPTASASRTWPVSSPLTMPMQSSRRSRRLSRCPFTCTATSPRACRP
jgi:pyruvate carboxylase subunit B